MGRILILDETTKNPLTLMGQCAGYCWGSDVSNEDTNAHRGIECLRSDHGRVSEYPQVYMILDEYSAKVIREFYTHIGGSPTRLQASTRYIDYGNFDYITPPSINRNWGANAIYKDTMKTISEAIQSLTDMGIKPEDANMLLPLSMTTKVVVRTNLRALIDMSRQRECTRAYWEFREMFSDIKNALSDYSSQWREIVDEFFKPKCEYLDYCPEKFSCGRKPQK